MQPQLAALKEISRFLDQHGFRYAVIGGIANAIWGQPRATLDADLKVVLDERRISDLVDRLRSSFKFRVADADAFVSRTYIAVDIGIGFLGYEQTAIERSMVVEHGGASFKVCTAEDLIIHKAISEREKDRADIEGVLVRQRSKLDQRYVLHWLTQFAEALEHPELLRRYLDLRRNLE